jgi:KUP system potassium uptake protein
LRAAVAVTALGVVFGDIGTSPLYTLHECVGGQRGVPVLPANVTGVLSLIFWSLTMVVTIKYLTVVMRADNHGEGGIFALLALLPGRGRARDGDGVATGIAGDPAAWAALLVIAGGALLYGDGMITPAISVLSAVEGLEVAAPSLHPLVLPMTCAILISLFLLQRRGTGSVGALFGPIMLLWFVTIAVLGVRQIVRHPAVLAALGPWHAVRFFATHGWRGFVVLGSVVLAVTGGEALYADMGHFGRGPIRLAWYAVAMPALVLNYFGQGALMLAEPGEHTSPFFAMVPPGPWTYGLVILSTLATVIASQALISGAFSMTAQAMQLGYLPRVTVNHTSRDTEGQIYVPEVNWALAVACVALVLGFRRSDNLAAAYGIAVTGTMVITSIVFFEVMRATWRVPLWKSLPLLLLFLSFDVPFFAANLLKLKDGGFVPLLVGAALFSVMVIWKRGRTIYRRRLAEASRPLETLLEGRSDERVQTPRPGRSPGTGVFLTSHAEDFPPIVLNLVERLHVLPETVVLLTIEIAHVPHVEDCAIRVDALGNGIHRVVARYGFMDHPNAPQALATAIRRAEPPIDLSRATYYIERDTFVATSAGEMGRVSEWVFAWLARNARPATDHFDIPPNQVVEIGSRIDL